MSAAAAHNDAAFAAALDTMLRVLPSAESGNVLAMAALDFKTRALCGRGFRDAHPGVSVHALQRRYPTAFVVADCEMWHPTEDTLMTYKVLYALQPYASTSAQAPGGPRMLDRASR